MTITKQREYFREMLEGDKVVCPISVFDPISARMADHLGAKLGILGGSIASAAVLAAPDLIVLTLTEFVDQIRRITRVSEISLMVDADHGYGNALNVMRTVEELEASGVSALTIEDTSLPARFRQKKGDELIETDEMVGKLRAAVRARKDPLLTIIGRTNAFTYLSDDEAVERVQALACSGVDAIMLLGVTRRQQIEEIRRVAPLSIVLGSMNSQLDDHQFLIRNGIRIVLQGHQPFFVAMKALYESMEYLCNSGPVEGLMDHEASQRLRDEVLDLQAYQGYSDLYLR